MKKRIPALLLCLCLLLTTPAMAAENSADNFTRSKTYAGEFTDLTADSTFYPHITALYEYGLSVGKADGSFGPQDSVTVGQIVIFASRIRSLYRTGLAESGAETYRVEGQAAYEPHLLYLQSEGVLAQELDGAYFSAASRAQVAHVLAGTLPPETLPPINDAQVTQGYASRRYIADVTEYTPYYQDILTLYRTGLSMGSDTAGSYLPDAAITRGAMAAMLTRMVDPALRVSLQWDLSPLYPSAVGTAMGDLVQPGVYIAAPVNKEEMDQDIRYMLAAGKSTLSLRYQALSPLSAQRVMEQSLSAVKSYCEQCYNTVSCSYSVNGDVTLTFSASSADGKLAAYRDETMAAAIAVHDQLWSEGIVTSSMTQKEKARAYYTWICNNCVYDYGAQDTSLSHIAYSLFSKGTAVCDGYTGAYNLLLKLEGISCTALSNETHIWTVAELDDVQYHIDTTWGDSGAFPSYDYFAMTPSQSWEFHSW